MRLAQTASESRTIFTPRPVKLQFKYNQAKFGDYKFPSPRPSGERVQGEGFVILNKSKLLTPGPLLV